ncbi:MAG: RIP metalloprotease RseP [candidate division Zixibacteria bacterium]|nr:RIP metalloprotease RseP [candidate division Zixibacteria bacterium]
MTTTIWATVFVLGVLIFIHELGHFLVAKWAGIKVERFSLGFPPKMIGKQIGETDYCISWVPLGGYVKMVGENPDEPSTGDPREFMSKSVGTRTLVILAGPLMNFIAAALIFIAVLWLHGRDTIDKTQVVVGPVVADGPADKIGIKTGDIIQAVDHNRVADFDSMAKLIHSRPGDTVEILWKHDGDLYSARVRTRIDTAKKTDGADTVVGVIGIGMGYVTETVGFTAAVSGGISQTFDFCGEMLKFLWGLFSGSVSIKNVSGPVGIAQIAGKVAREGWAVLMNFMAVLSLNLALLNILPVPILDGGHLVFLLIEKLRGRPLSMKQRAVAQQVGMLLLVLLIVTVTYHDIARFISG